jgi:lysophospholipase L1-like esterase
MRARRLVLPLLVGVLLFSEVILRATGPLPSLATATAPFEPSERPAVVAPGPDLRECIDPPGTVDGPAPRAWEATFDGVEPTIRLLVAGDSMVLGPGVEREATATWLMGVYLATATGQRVITVNAGLNAAGYCGVIRAVHQHLDEAAVDAIVVMLFADDLEQHAFTLVGGSLRADPSRLATGPIRTLLSTSYVANAVWFAGLKVALNGQDSAPAWVDRGPRNLTQFTRDNLAASMRRLDQRAGPTWALLAPAGLASCPENPDPTSECAWLTDDLHTLSATLETEVGAFVDLRGLWEEGGGLESELANQTRTGRLAVHPNAKGHEEIAAALAPWALKRVGSARQRRR